MKIKNFKYKNCEINKVTRPCWVFTKKEGKIKEPFFVSKVIETADEIFAFETEEEYNSQYQLIKNE